MYEYIFFVYIYEICIGTEQFSQNLQNIPNKSQKDRELSEYLDSEYYSANCVICVIIHEYIREYYSCLTQALAFLT